MRSTRDPPELALSELEGFAFIFKGAMLGVRGPKAHAPFEELEERRGD